ncbi:MAG: nucleotidyltransferase family protein [Synergistaceae bacterium]|nr:nucleotidyltransferase family protein [Synergistaceae bacterium]
MENALGKLNKSTPVIGVIAEYDPFHNGHVLHLAKAREALKHAGTTVPVVVTLSSSFTQRGLPAFADKTARAKMALAGGVNLVLELPFVHACNSGPEFARGAVGIMAAARFVTHLAFGAENASVFSQKNEDEPFLDNLLRILIQEPFSFKSNLRENLASGCSYPKALALALERERPGSHNIVSSPNNALAVSYLAEIQRGGYELIPIPVQREGGAHNDEAPGLFGGFAGLAGAAAIRKSLSGRDSADWVKDAVPDSVMSILTEEKDMGRLCSSTGKLWDQLRGLLARSTPGALRACAGMDEGLENLFLKHYARADSYEDFIGRCVCARYTRGRLQRQAARCLAGLDRETAAALSRSAPPYIRVLGYDELGRELLRERKKRGDAAVPIITRLPAAGQKGGAMAKKTADAEFRASRLRELLLPNPDLTREERLIPCRKS